MANATAGLHIGIDDVSIPSFRAFSADVMATNANARSSGRSVFVAERVGFEPTNAFWTLLEFQSSAFDHSATSPDGLRSVHARVATG